MQKKTKIIIIIGIIFSSLFIWSYLHYKKETKGLTDYERFGKVTKVETWKPLGDLGTRAIIWRWSKMPQKGQVRMICLEKYLKLQIEGKFR